MPTPYFDYHALAPEIVLTAVALIALVVDLVWRESARYIVPQIAGIGLLVALIPVLTLAADGETRSMFGGAFVVDNYSLAFTGFFLVVGYVTLLLSYDYIAEGDYYQGEYYVLILTSVLGMIVMASARDLISIFVALETITLPTFVLAGWRKYDTKSNEAAIKYFLIGVLSTAVMLWAFWRARRAPLAVVLASCVVAIHAYTVLSVQVHENHFYLALPLIAAAGTLLPRMRAPYALASGVCLFNLLIFQGLGRDYMLPLRRLTIIDASVILSFVNIGALVWHAQRFARLHATRTSGSERVGESEGRSPSV